MNGFFKTYRRNIGVVTLAVAYMFTVAWVRSQFICDWVSVYSTDDRLFVLRSGYDCLSLQTWFDPHDPPPIIDSPMDWGSYQIGLVPPLEPIEQSRIPDPVEIPYWSIVIPLTVLSTALLLCRSRSPMDLDNS